MKCKVCGVDAFSKEFCSSKCESEFFTRSIPLQTALDVQVGGSHYKEYTIQPIEFIQKNNIPFIEGNIIKYICRWKRKNKEDDILKAIHYCKLLLELECNYDTKNMHKMQGD